MVIEGKSDIIISVEPYTFLNGINATALTLKNENILIITADSFGLYKSMQLIQDPLGNGLLSMSDIPKNHQLTSVDGSYVLEYQAGYIGLVNEKVALITPNDIQLFPDKPSALRNINEIARISLA